MIKLADYIPRLNRIFYTSLTLISAILLGSLGKLSESNNNTALAQENIPVLRPTLKRGFDIIPAQPELI